MTNQRGVPVEAFPAKELEERVNVLPNSKARYPPIKLSDCELLKLTQYKCHPEPKSRQVVCKPFMRLFRKYVPLSVDSLLLSASSRIKYDQSTK
jgi:Mitochondrial export protein Som1